MKLTEEQRIVCDVFRRRDKTGYVHCNECPMRLSNRYAVCLKTVTKKDAKECWDWDGSPYPVLESRVKTYE